MKEKLKAPQNETLNNLNII